MKTKRYELILEAETPIAHHAETLGNSAIAMRTKIRQADGSWAQVPIVTADTMRHGLREAASYAVLDAAGMLDGRTLSEGALRLLFAGGMVTGRGDASVIKLDGYRELCELLPHLEILGGCVDNRVVPGRLFVEDAILVCDESAHLVPIWVQEWAKANRGPLDTHRAHIEEVQRVRMDPTLVPEKRRLLAAGDAERVEQRLLKGEIAHAEDDAVAREDAKSSMLPRRYEEICRGSLFSWRVTATLYGALDEDTFDTMICAFLANCRVGGKRGTGCGSLRAVIGNEVPVLRPRDAHTAVDFGLAPTKGKIFRDHVAARAERIKSFLGSVNA